MNKIDVGLRIKRLMKEHKITQTKLSQESGIIQSSISDMLSGKRNILPLVEAVCTLYGFSRDYIITGEEHKLSDIIAKNDIPKDGLSQSDKMRLLDKLESLYERHQVILNTISKATQESGEVLKEIATINKLLVAGI